MPPRVEFYVLPESLAAARFACDMTERARREGLSVHIQAASRDDALELSDLLWTFRDISFLPHCLADENRDPGSAPVVVGWAGMPPRSHELLINLDDDIPEFAAEFWRVVEPVPARPSERGRSREHWQRYKEMGCELQNRDFEGSDGDA
jgi:DNA polymerase IIIc chi subunit